MDIPFRLLVVSGVLTMGFYHSQSQQLYVGSPCKNSDSEGFCTAVKNCSVAITQIKEQRRHDLTRCTFVGFDEIVCCPDPSARHVTPPDDTTEQRTTNVISKSGKACEAYAKKLPIVLSYHIVGGENANLGDFPHMAALGFYNEPNDVYKFDCGGTLISNHYVVTAAHCIINIEQNELRFARMGVIDVPASVTTPDPKIDYDVANVTVHQEYNWKEKFNDIALVKLKKKVTFTDYIRPACLYSKNDDPKKLIVTGWGALSLGGERSSRLQKADLAPVSISECNVTYIARTKRNIIKSQICAADNRSDACQGDSGGPIQVQNNNSLLTIVGITSYGIGCGSKYPGVYTRINSYIDWIEGIVWP